MKTFVALNALVTEKAIEAALKFRFQPAMKDGQPITVTREEGFSFSIY